MPCEDGVDEADDVLVVVGVLADLDFEVVAVRWGGWGEAAAVGVPTADDFAPAFLVEFAFGSDFDAVEVGSGFLVDVGGEVGSEVSALGVVAFVLEELGHFGGRGDHLVFPVVGVPVTLSSSTVRLVRKSVLVLVLVLVLVRDEAVFDDGDEVLHRLTFSAGVGDVPGFVQVGVDPAGSVGGVWFEVIADHQNVDVGPADSKSPRPHLLECLAGVVLQTVCPHFAVPDSDRSHGRLLWGVGGGG